MQNGPVWFLPNIPPGAGKVVYTCTIPHDKDIMLHLTSTECESGGVEGIMSDDELKQCAFNILTPIDNIEVILDGTKIDLKNLGQPIQTNFFNVTYPQNPTDMWGEVKPGTYRAIAEGYFLFLHNLSLGKHNIETKVVDILTYKVDKLTGKMIPEQPAEGLFEINII